MNENDHRRNAPQVYEWSTETDKSDLQVAAPSPQQNRSSVQAKVSPNSRFIRQSQRDRRFNHENLSITAHVNKYRI